MGWDAEDDIDLPVPAELKQEQLKPAARLGSAVALGGRIPLSHDLQTPLTALSRVPGDAAPAGGDALEPAAAAVRRPGRAGCQRLRPPRRLALCVGVGVVVTADSQQQGI